MHQHDLILMRHGETEWNRARRMQGQLNSPLTEKGEAQARHLRALLEGFDLSGWDLHCSPSGRALCTAGLALGDRHQPIRSDDRLMEIDVGEWSGLLADEVRALRPDLFADAGAGRFTWYDAAPGGEGYAGLEARCRAFLADLRGPTLCVTHGITLRMLRSLALAGDASRLTEGDFVRQGVLWRIRNGISQEISEAGQLGA